MLHQLLNNKLLQRSFTVISLSIMLWTIAISHAQAQVLSSLRAVPAPQYLVATVGADVMEQLKTEFMPQIENILTPEQQDKLQSLIAAGETSLRKAFKSITLTPDQKSKIASLLKSLPKKEIFTSMSPEQKREFFIKKKELFKPTAEEIAGYKAQGGK